MASTAVKVGSRTFFSEHDTQSRFSANGVLKALSLLFDAVSLLCVSSSPMATSNEADPLKVSFLSSPHTELSMSFPLTMTCPRSLATYCAMELHGILAFFPPLCSFQDWDSDMSAQGVKHTIEDDIATTKPHILSQMENLSSDTRLIAREMLTKSEIHQFAVHLYL